MMRPLLAVVCSVGLLACGNARPSSYPTHCPDWQNDIAALTAETCTGCHNSARTEGSYRTETYFASVSPRDDGTPRLIPGDADGSLLIRAAMGELPGHGEVSPSTLRTLRRWVECRAPSRHFAFHLPGWSTPGDGEQFHGVALRALAYDTQTCTQCHGDDLDGGAAHIACTSCHVEGPQSCSTCHGDDTSAAPPRSVGGVRSPQAIEVGAHRVHLRDSSLHKAYGCEVCHVTPKAPGDEGHYQNGGALDPSPAEVVILGAGGKAAHFDRADVTCENSACHAPSVDSNASRQNPRWTALGRGDADCGTCHGLPPSSHVDNRCEGCHAKVYRDGHIVAPDLHANGTVEVGDGSGACTSCHGDAESPAPPRDLEGQTDPKRPSVGAHRAHLKANRFRGPVPCAECHLVPTKPLDRGHIDSSAPAEVFPDESGVGTLARTDSAAATFSHGSATCGSVYCHGGGRRAARDTSVGLVRTPVWAGASTAQVFCGSCHGLPPKDGLHTQPLARTECVKCHAASVTGTGEIRFETLPDGGVTSTHLDGRVQLGASP